MTDLNNTQYFKKVQDTEIEVGEVLRYVNEALTYYLENKLS